MVAPLAYYAGVAAVHGARTLAASGAFAATASRVSNSPAVTHTSQIASNAISRGATAIGNASTRASTSISNLLHRLTGGGSDPDAARGVVMTTEMVVRKGRERLPTLGAAFIGASATDAAPEGNDPGPAPLETAAELGNEIADTFWDGVSGLNSGINPLR